MTVSFGVRYDGRDASQHVLDMRLLGRSLIGLDKIVNDGVIVLREGRPPKRGERADFTIKAGSPQMACVDIHAWIDPLLGVLPFVYDEVVKLGPEFIWRLLSYLLTKLGGRPKEAEPHFAALMDFAKDLNQSRDRSEERLHDTMRMLIDRLTPSAKELVAPVGPSCDRLTLRGPTGGQTTEIDVPMADAVRAKERLEVGDQMRMTVKVDGLVLHNRHLTIEHPDKPGKFLNADVRDPAFDVRPNVYTDAVDRWLEVDVKPTRRATGELAALYIMNAVGKPFDREEAA
jgi:hypothetical protein